MLDNKGFVCHKHTSMCPVEIHHVWPKGYHGPDIASNKIKICPNAHSAIHFLMELMLRGKPYNPHHYGATIRHYAEAGYRAVMAYGEDSSPRSGTSDAIPIPV